MMYTKEDFNKVWKDSSREDILNQFYYEHKDMEKFKNIINELEKWITFSDTESYNPKLYYDDVCKCEYIYTDDLLDKLRELKGKDNE